MNAAVATRDFAGYISAVERELHDLICLYSGVTVDAAMVPVRLGGKRLRPLLVLAGAPRAEPSPAVVRAGAAVELVHTASLLHDDIIDNAIIRRGMPTAHVAHGEDAAVAGGDLMFSCAFRALATIEGVERDRVVHAIELLACSAYTLARGEVRQADQALTADIAIDHYLERCAMKTGALFGASLALGAILGGGTREATDLLERFGVVVGTAFQLVDDALDCSSSQEELGKAPGTDILDGTTTMPILIAARNDDRVASELRRAAPDAAQVLEWIGESGSVDITLGRAEQMVERALPKLDDLPEAFDLALLREVAGRAVQRTN